MISVCSYGHRVKLFHFTEIKVLYAFERHIASNMLNTNYENLMKKFMKFTRKNMHLFSSLLHYGKKCPCKYTENIFLL